MLTYLIVLACVIVVVMVVAATRQPDTFCVKRTMSMDAPAIPVFAKVNNFHRWDQWSPWAKVDPAMKVIYEGPDEGVGSSYAWEGNRKAGAGKMTILESRPGEMVRIWLEFLKPFAATNEAVFTFTSVGLQTHVSWVMTGKNNFLFKVMPSVMNMDKMVGPDFERGLAQMKTAIENEKYLKEIHHED